MPDPETLFGHKVTSTLQIGDPSVIAAHTAVTTVGDFRVADMAVGGQGAPLVPYLDQTLALAHYSATSRLAIFLNVGGMSNISWCDITSSQSSSTTPTDMHCPAYSVLPVDKPIGFDCGPGCKWRLSIIHIDIVQ